MSLGTPRRIAVLAVTALIGCLAAASAFAQTPTPPTPPTPNKGDVAWMLTASVLVLLMTVPGLALFYGGLVRTKNMLSMLMQVFFVVCIVCIIWVVYGYSLAFSEGGSLNAYVGGLSKAFLAGITPDTTAETFTNGVVIPEYVYICFQMTFACITPALIVGAMAERMKFSALVLFIPLWVTFVYFPIAHMVWYWAGPSATVSAAKALAEATGDAKTAAQAAMDAVTANAGLAFGWGALDFAGGTVVHINSGIAGLMGALLVGRRVGYGKEAMPPHSLTMTLVGAALLWVGWFGFNAGSALEAGGTAALAMINTFVATAAAALAWMLGEKTAKGKPSLLGGASGAVAGLVAVTPAAGFAGPMGAIVLGIVAGFVCMFFCSAIKNALGYDDALDVFGVHCIGGIVGAIGTGILAAPMLGGAGVFDYAAGKVGDYDMMAQVIIQAKTVCLTLIWSGLGSFILFSIVKMVIGLRPGTDQEREGLDLVDHGERAYNY
jgi:ammonium transporter, Amt family